MSQICLLNLRVGLYCIFVSFLCLVCVIESTTTGNASFNLSKNCFFLNFACKQSRSNKHCPEGQRCVMVKSVLDPDTNTTKCEYICEPPIELSPSFPPSLNGSDSGNITDIEVNEPTTERPPLSWRENPAHCSRNFICDNGGHCDKEYKENSTGRQPFCVCAQHWSGPFCLDYCPKQCENNGTCTLVNGPDGNTTQKCNCLREFSGRECEIRDLPSVTQPPKEKLVWFIPVLIALGILSFLAVTYVILHKLKWRSLFVTKLFHYLQPYEDDDGKEFDAFVSFRSSNNDYSQSEDEKFVLRVLQPMLEKEFQYKICVHYRDFLPGETIANNIIWAVENSRRTILILSPLYIHSEWARMEYQKAQQEMLQLRHKIIPIIFDDISDTPIDDPTLKHILSSVTYIHYPKSNEEKAQSKFWQMVGLALPKKRPIDIEAPVSSAHPTVRLSASQTLMSQESWQSSRTDTTDIEMDEVFDDDDVGDNNDVGENNDVTNNMSSNVAVDINEADKLRIKPNGGDKLQLETLNNNVDKYISILEGVS